MALRACMMIGASVVGAILAPCAVGSTLQIFGSETTFLRSAPIVSTETFDEIPSTTHFIEPDIEIDGVFYLNSPTGDIQGWSITNSIGGAPSKPNVLVSNSLTENHISFGTGRFVQALGFFMVGGGTSNGVGARYRFVVTEDNDAQTSFLIDFAPPGVKYFGFLSEQGIADVAIGPDPAQDFGVFFAFDNVSRSEILGTAVVEPGTFALTFWTSVVIITMRFRFVKRAPSNFRQRLPSAPVTADRYGRAKRTGFPPLNSHSATTTARSAEPSGFTSKLVVTMANVIQTENHHS
jgi:hypothetical protein